MLLYPPTCVEIHLIHKKGSSIYSRKVQLMTSPSNVRITADRIEVDESEIPVKIYVRPDSRASFVCVGSLPRGTYILRSDKSGFAAQVREKTQAWLRSIGNGMEIYSSEPTVVMLQQLKIYYSLVEKGRDQAVRENADLKTEITALKMRMTHMSSTQEYLRAKLREGRRVIEQMQDVYCGLRNWTDSKRTDVCEFAVPQQQTMDCRP
jgi:hypothetical protein